MNLPPSLLLGRLEAFLPEMEKANRTTEKLANQGKLEVLDGNLEVAGTDQQSEEAEGIVEEDEMNEAEQDDSEDGAAGSEPRTVQLDFALGDFDDTPIAKMEQEKETASSQEEASAPSSVGEQAEGTGGGISKGRGFLHIVPKTRVDAAPQRQKPSKPLIEEL